MNTVGSTTRCARTKGSYRSLRCGRHTPPRPQCERPLHSKKIQLDSNVDEGEIIGQTCFCRSRSLMSKISNPIALPLQQSRRCFSACGVSLYDSSATRVGSSSRVSLSFPINRWSTFCNPPSPTQKKKHQA